MQVGKLQVASTGDAAAFQLADGGRVQLVDLCAQRQDVQHSREQRLVVLCVTSTQHVDSVA